jgi:hypothetical protein
MSSHIQLKLPISARLAGSLPTVDNWPLICQRNSRVIEAPEARCRRDILKVVYRGPELCSLGPIF